MKRLVRLSIATFMSFFLYSLSYAQTLEQQIDYALAPLDMSLIDSKILIDRRIPLLSLSDYVLSELSDSTYSSLSTDGAMCLAMHAAQLPGTDILLEPLTAYIADYDNYTVGDPISMLLSAYHYHQLDPDGCRENKFYRIS